MEMSTLKRLMHAADKPEPPYVFNAVVCRISETLRLDAAQRN